MSKYIIDTQQLHTLRDFLGAQTKLSSQFISRKMAIAAKNLLTQGYTRLEVASILNLVGVDGKPSEDSVDQLIKNHIKK